MQITKDVLTKYKWQCIEISAEHWPNPRSTPDERTFMIAVGGDIALPKRVWWKAAKENSLTPHYTTFKQLELHNG